jgi:SAM-dependent methyltransferase
MSEPRYLRDVRDQYEAYPFPKRDPESERRRLITCELDMLGKVNHYGFRGRQSFGPDFRALVAGGGTGDSAIFLAEQLRGRGGRVTYLDISRGSMGIAQKRAKIRGLDNIDWLHGSILDLPRLGLAPFDYVNCAGVLHHMADPDEGLRCLAAVVKEEGCLGLMVYGRYGRLDYYVTQDLLRLALGEEASLAKRVADAKSVLERLPPNNVLMRGRDRAAALKFFLDDEPNLVDALLHPQDRAYSVAELYDFTAQAGLRLVAFTNYQSIGGVCRLEYDPALYLEGLPVLDRIRRLPLPQQQTIAEIINGSMGLHSFYATRHDDTVAEIADNEMVPFYLTSHGVEACRALLSAGDGGLSVNLRFGLKLRLELHPATRRFLPLVDGARDMGTLLGLVDGEAAAEVRAAIAADFATLNALNWLVLRHRSAAPIATIPKTYGS